MHANAPLSPTGRLRVARCVVEDGWTVRTAAERYGCSHTTVARWARRYRDRPGGVDPLQVMQDRSSRPRTCPHQTAPSREADLLRLRREKGWGPARLGPAIGTAASTAHRVLRRHDVAPLAHVDRATRAELRARVRRYERDRPGELVHADVKKLGLIPDGGGWRVHGRQATRGSKGGRSQPPSGTKGYAYLHTVIDDHSRVAYTEVLADETAVTTVAFFGRALQFFADAGAPVERVLTDNGANYRSRDFLAACAAHRVTAKKTRPYRPQTNGKVERYHRTLLEEWAYSRPWTSETQRTASLPAWLHEYNVHRTHLALGGRPPASRVTNLAGQHS